MNCFCSSRLHLPMLIFIFGFCTVLQLKAEPHTGTAQLLKLIRPEQQSLLDSWREDFQKQVRELASSTEINEESRTHLSTIRQLIEHPNQTIADEADLIGNWRVRSLQLSHLGAYIYPYFTCRITRNDDGTLRFHKSTGSQRKFGSMARLKEDTFLFVGAAYYGYENVRDYSSRIAQPGHEDLERDTIGRLFKLAKNHYLMVFATDAERSELYEMKK